MLIYEFIVQFYLLLLEFCNKASLSVFLNLIFGLKTLYNLAIFNCISYLFCGPTYIKIGNSFNFS